MTRITQAQVEKAMRLALEKERAFKEQERKAESRKKVILGGLILLAARNIEREGLPKDKAVGFFQFLANQKGIALPPLEVQREIVAEIEGYQRVIDGARAVIDNYRPRIPVDPEWEMSTIGEVCNLVRGSSPRPKGDPAFYDGPVPRLMVADITRDGMLVTPQIDSLGGKCIPNFQRDSRKLWGYLLGSGYHVPLDRRIDVINPAGWLVIPAILTQPLHTPEDLAFKVLIWRIARSFSLSAGHWAGFTSQPNSCKSEKADPAAPPQRQGGSLAVAGFVRPSCDY